MLDDVCDSWLRVSQIERLIREGTTGYYHSTYTTCEQDYFHENDPKVGTYVLEFFIVARIAESFRFMC